MSHDYIDIKTGVCKTCGHDHNLVTVKLENGGHIITRPFQKDKATKVSTTEGKRRATRLDLVNVFWPTDGVDV